MLLDLQIFLFLVISYPINAISARATKAANIEQKINKPPLKEHSAVCLVLACVQIGEGQNFQRALIAMLQKLKKPKIQQRTIASG